MTLIMAVQHHVVCWVCAASCLISKLTVVCSMRAKLYSKNACEMRGEVHAILLSGRLAHPRTLAFGIKSAPDRLTPTSQTCGPTP